MAQQKVSTPVSNEMLTAIGRVTLHFSLLDHLVSLYISLLVPLSTDATSDMHSKYIQSASTRIWLLEKLWSPKSQDLAAFRALVARMNAINTDRNRFAHDIWTMSETEPHKALRVRLAASFDLERATDAAKTYDLTEINKFAAEIIEASIELNKQLYPKIFGEPAPH